MDIATDNTLLDAVLAAARKLGIAVEALESESADRGADFVVRIGDRGHDRTYAAEIKRGLRPATLGAALYQIERLDQPGLLIADYVTPPMAETLKARGIAFLDAAGNAYLNQPPLLVWVKGQRPTTKFAGGLQTGRAFRPGGLKVLFALLCHPEWVAWSYRDLAELAPHQYDVQLGGEVAAARITGYLRPGTVTLYGKKAEPPLLLDYKLRPDPAGPVEFVKRFWAFETDDEALVPLSLIYADLLMLGDARCLETADLICEKILDGLDGFVR